MRRCLPWIPLGEHAGSVTTMTLHIKAYGKWTKVSKLSLSKKGRAMPNSRSAPGISVPPEDDVHFVWQPCCPATGCSLA